LFTAPLLHANLVHVVCNGLALLLGGTLLERLVGRLWFFAYFAVGALGGSLMSFAIAPANQVSVGASGALMGLFAALFVGGFRLTSGTQARLRLQINSLRVLIPSLVPVLSTTSAIHIDYGAHFGGAISGALLAVVLLKTWPKTARIPQMRTVGTVISIAGGVLFVISGSLAAANYPKYERGFVRSNLMQANSDNTKKAVLARIPIGTDVRHAHAVMESEGFICSRIHSAFAEDRPGGGPQINNPPADILWCDSGERMTTALLISKRWQVIFVDEGGRVTRVAVGVGLTGP
jgi:hypothetical protein